MFQFDNRESPAWANSLADDERLAIEWLVLLEAGSEVGSPDHSDRFREMATAACNDRSGLDVRAEMPHEAASESARSFSDCVVHNVT